MKRAIFLSGNTEVENGQVFKKIRTFDDVAESVYLTFSLPNRTLEPLIPPPHPRTTPLIAPSHSPPPPQVYTNTEQSTTQDSLYNPPPISPVHSVVSVSAIAKGGVWDLIPSAPSTPLPQDSWAFQGFEGLSQDNSRASGEFTYKRWQSPPATVITDEIQVMNIRRVLKTSLEGKYKADWWTSMLRKVLKNGNEWMESKEFFDTYTSGREKANGGIFHDTQSPEVIASRLQIVDERKYKVNKGTFFEQIKRQLRVNPVHLKIFRELVSEQD